MPVAGRRHPRALLALHGGVCAHSSEGNGVTWVHAERQMDREEQAHGSE